MGSTSNNYWCMRYYFCQQEFKMAKRYYKSDDVKWKFSNVCKNSRNYMKSEYSIICLIKSKQIMWKLFCFIHLLFLFLYFHWDGLLHVIFNICVTTLYVNLYNNQRTVLETALVHVARYMDNNHKIRTTVYTREQTFRSFPFNRILFRMD